MTPLLVASLLLAADPPPYPVGTPPPHVDLWGPERAVVEADYDCGGKPVRLAFVVEEGRVRITEYVGTERAANPVDLAQWNAWLEDVGRYRRHQFACGPRHEMVWFHGVDASGGTSVGVFWNEGRLGRLP